MIVIELDVDSVKIECALFGSYVDDLTAFLAAGDVVQPVLIIQFVKVKTFKGKTVLQNVMHATRILFNPDIPEVADFRKRLPLLGDEPSQTLSHLTESPNIYVEDDFLKLTPRMSIEQLKDVREEGFCIVLATAKHIIKGSDWWYTACKCNKAVTPDSGMYYCDSCYCHIVNVFPRYRIKLRVINDSDCATFVLFDRYASYLLKRFCTEMLDLFQKNKKNSLYPPEFDVWIDKSFLFKVEIKCNTASQFEPSFRVRRVCDDVAIITKFMQSESAMTPKEAVMTEDVSVSEINIATDIPEVDSGVAKDLMSQFCDSETCLNSQPECVELNVYGDKRFAEEYSANENADMSTTKFKQVKIEKD